MTPEEALRAAEADHIPVLRDEIVAALDPQDGQLIIDGTFGAGGYSRALLAAADCTLVGIDRDPDALAEAARWASLYGARLRLHAGTFGALEAALAPGEMADAVVLDIGVSSMQLDRAARGFSFLRDGPLDMRMAQDGPSAADIVNLAAEEELADMFFQYGEERRSRALARAVVAARAAEPLRTTGALAGVIESHSPRTKPGQPHPATRVFQALRIAVNDELGELARGMSAAEHILKPGGRLAVVTFHSLEDRAVKRFFQNRAQPRGAGVSRHMPAQESGIEPSFTLPDRKPRIAGAAEIAANPRARSAKLRVGLRTEAPAHPLDPTGLGLPGLAVKAVRQ